MVPLDEVVHFDVVTHSPTTGNAADADSTPTFEVFEEDTDTPIIGSTNLTKRTGKTGNYRGAFTASAAGGFESGKWYSVIASATVGGVSGKTTALVFRARPAESAVGVPKVDATHFGGVANPYTAGDGLPEVRVVRWANGANSLSFNVDAGTDFPIIMLYQGDTFGAGLANLVSAHGGGTLDVRNVSGKVLGGGATAITGIGAWAAGASGATLATQGDILNVSNNTRVRATIPTFIERPDSGSESLTFTIELYDAVGNMEAPDSMPTVALVDRLGNDLSSRVSPLANPSTGRYTFTYTNSAADALDWLRWTVTVVEGGVTRTYSYGTTIVDTTAVDFTAADRTKLDAIKGKTDQFTFSANLVLADVRALDGDINSPVFLSDFANAYDAGNTGWSTLDAVGVRGAIGMATANLDTQLSGIHIKTVNLPADPASNTQVNTRLAASAYTAPDNAGIATLIASLSSLAGKFAGITLLANWLRAVARKANNDAVAINEINADSGSGVGTYNPADDANEAIRDRGDAAWTTGAGGGGGGNSYEFDDTDVRIS